MQWFKAVLIRAALLLLLWWSLTEGDGGWWFGLPLTLLVVVISLWLSPPGRYTIRPLQAAGFGVYFIAQSLRAGLDVAGRILHPRLPLQPEIITLRLELPPGAPCWLLMTTLSLLPGTLCVRLQDQQLSLHCLDTRMDVVASVRIVEQRIARVFGLSLPVA